MRRRIALTIVALGFALAGPLAGSAQAPEPATGVRFPAIAAADLKEWLTYIASDELQGREVFSEGYGIAAEYIAERLRQWHVMPLGDHGSYFQIVKLRSYNVTRNSTVTVEVNGQSRTFRDGDHVTFPATAGGRQTVAFNGFAFVGAGQPDELTRLDLRGKFAVVGTSPAAGRNAGRVRAVSAIRLGAGAAVSYLAPAPAPSAPASDDAARPAPATSSAARADIPATPARVDAVTPPLFTGDDAFFDFLLSAGPTPFADVKARLGRNEAIAPFPVAAVKITVDVDNAYEPVTTRLTRNVVGMVQGSDPGLRNTYVLFGAHLDHVGYSVNDRDQHLDGSPVGAVRNPIETDKIWNGADDDGTGTTAELAIAKAFAAGPKPKRSVVFMWHAGEEADLYGSRYNADFPVVPLEQIQCQLNIDMIGRNRDNDPAQSNTLFVIGADRISTDLHNLIVDTNATLAAPLKLDYEYNDATDPNSFYTRSDHYSYASKGIPIAFFFTGTHPDYHANSDSVEKILFDKQARIAQLVYQAGFAIADSERTLNRDNRGPRAGKGFSGKIPK